MRKVILIFLFGLVLGVVAGVLIPRWATPHLPQALRAEETVTEGVVVAKQRRDDQLLLTVDTDEGAVLATFHDKLDEISLLVDEGDTVGLGLKRYEPFVEDPPVRRVIKKRLAPQLEVPSRLPPGAEESPAALEALPGPSPVEESEVPSDPEGPRDPEEPSDPLP